MKIATALDRFLTSMAGARSPQTVSWYRRHLTPLVDYLGPATDVGRVTLSDLREWRAVLSERKERWADHPSRPTVKGGLSSWTVYGHVKCVRALFRWLAAEGVLKENIADRLELPKRSRLPRRGVDDKVADRIIAVARQGVERDYALVMFLAETASRVGGIAGLKISDLDLEGGSAVVCEKGEMGRTVFFGKETARAMRAWLEVRPALDDDHVFLGERGALRGSGVYQVVERLARKAGIQGNGWNPHAWRHAAARTMLQNGASLSSVSQLLGHSSIEVTARFYASFSVAELQGAFMKYSRYTTTMELPQ